MKKPIASLSLDLDNKWAYMRTLGAAGWDEYPSYLDVVLPRVLRVCAERDLRITCFVVGLDAARYENRGLLSELAAAGHEIGNHSQHHWPWMHTMGRDQVEAEIVDAEEHIESATGRRPIGFRGPGFSLSRHSLEVIAERGYLYDATSWPTYVGPLARWYVGRNTSPEASGNTSRLFGSWRDGFRPLKPHLVKTDAGQLVEIPVSTFPIVKLPIHATYLFYLWQVSPRLSRAYLQTALTACRWMGVGPSILLHPLDFLGAEDDPDLRCMPGMNLPRAQKVELLNHLLSGLAARFELVPMCEQAALAGQQLGLTQATRRTPLVVAEPLIAAGHD